MFGFKRYSLEFRSDRTMINNMSLLPEINQIESCIEKLGEKARAEVVDFSEHSSLKLPIYKISLGSTDPKAPTLGFTAGIHGLERIGSQVCIALMKSLTELVLWDNSVQNTLNSVRIFFIPTVNPIGILQKTRSNPRGVDLMRNAPVEAENPVTLVGGHRISRYIPWYRGETGAEMEMESRALISAVEREIGKSSLAITLDLHSGFGLKDRLWFPYAKTIHPFPGLPLAYSFKKLLDRTYPHHFYQIEPQAQTYSTHGDLWDYIYDCHCQQNGNANSYLPLCLEMGSWLWIKKNPWQIFKMEGPFNPLKIHRHRRILRRHNTLMDFLIRAIYSAPSWAVMNEIHKSKLSNEALEHWYATK